MTLLECHSSFVCQQASNKRCFIWHLSLRHDCFNEHLHAGQQLCHLLQLELILYDALRPALCRKGESRLGEAPFDTEPAA